MALLTFRCVSCAMPLQCQEGAGELFRCPHCEHVGTVPRPFLNAPQAPPRRERPARPREEALDQVWDETATRGWRWTARGLRFIHSSLWVLVLCAGLTLVVNVGAVLVLAGLDLPRPIGRADEFIALTMLPLAVIALLQELASIIGQCMCICVPPGGNRRMVAIAALLASVVLWVTLVLGVVLLNPLIQRTQPGAQPPGQVLAWSATLQLIDFLRWLATVDFARVIARSLGDKSTARSASMLMLTAIGVIVLTVLAMSVLIFMQASKDRPDRWTNYAALGLLVLGVFASIALLIWFLSVLRRAYLAIESSLKESRIAEL